MIHQVCVNPGRCKSMIYLSAIAIRKVAQYRLSGLSIILSSGVVQRWRFVVRGVVPRARPAPRPTTAVTAGGNDVADQEADDSAVTLLYGDGERGVAVLRVYIHHDNR
jgi:hypothetical protein